jgi:UDP-N-acetylmuramoyl-tripeptide--D-alanyl-D-alanine ligase
MKKFLIVDLARMVQSYSVGSQFWLEHTPSARGVCTGVSTDSRTVQPGDCFFAIAGENFDGHDYVADAFVRGAVCAVVSRDVKLPGRSILKVNDTVEALGNFAREYRRQADFKVVGITGSVGKTTTRQIAYHVLSQHYRVFQSPKNFNNQIGLPLTLLNADPEHQIVVAELATNHPGEITYLTRIAQPDVAMVTNVHPAHLEGFGDLQAIVQEKLSISQGLTKDGIFIINGDQDHLVDACRAKGIEFLTFGESDGLDFQARDIHPTGTGSTFSIEGRRINLPLPGPGNIENALAAWAVCSQFELTIDDFAQAMKTLAAVSMRAELLQIGSLTVLNDSYNANPASMKNALRILADLGRQSQAGPFGFPLDFARDMAQGRPARRRAGRLEAATRRLVFICGDMAELGQQADRLHAELGAATAQAKVQLLLAVGSLARIVAQAARKTADYDLHTECFEDTVSVCDNLAKFIKDGDIILVKGSRIAGLDAVVEKLKQLFA